LQFDGKVENRTAPIRLTTSERRRFGEERDAYLARGGWNGAEDDPVHEHGVIARKGCPISRHN